MNNGADQPASEAYKVLSQYFKGSYFTGQLPPIQIAFTPFTAVIDLETMTVMFRATLLQPGTTQQLLNLANQAASN